jgi:hypothetical protein
VREISPLRSRAPTPTRPSASPETISACQGYLIGWTAVSTSRTAGERMKDLRRFGRWQWGDDRPAVILAWLLDLQPADAAEVVARFDAIEARTSSRAARKRRLHHIRGALKFAAGERAPKIAPAVKDAA